MRNLKKLLALVVACVMVFGVVASAAVVNFPDVESTAKYAEAVKVLSALNIINGDDKGNFNPDKDVTRAEMAKILCAMIGAGTQGQVDSGFADVTAAHWAAGYVKYAKGLNIINGYNDKEFGPEDNVTYEQAIKLIVAALGFSYMADDMGGYPSGYMMVAADQGITDKVVITDASAPAKRSDIAMLAYNALEVKMMERTSYGTEAKYEVPATNAKTLLNNKLGVYSFDGYVSNTYLNDADLDEGEIYYVINKTTKAAVEALDLEDLDPSKDYEAYALVDMACVDETAPELLYYSSKAYTAENEDGDWEIIAVVAKTNKIKEVVFDDLKVLTDNSVDTSIDNDEKQDIDGAINGLTLKYGTLSYWKTADHDDRRPQTLKVAGNYTAAYTDDQSNYHPATYATAAKIVVNNKKPRAIGASDVTANTNGVLKVIDTNNDGYYDLFVLTEYMIGVVDSVREGSMTINFKNQSGTVVNTIGTRTLSIDPDVIKNIRDFTITLDGEAAEFTDLQKNDVVFLATNGNPAGSWNPTYINIIAVRDAVEGKITTNLDADGIIEIDGKEYEVASPLRTALGLINAGAKGTFYRAANGVIAAYEATNTISEDYAYIYKVGTSSFQDKSVRMLTADGDDVTYDVADRIEINGQQAKDANNKASAKVPYTAAQMTAMFGGAFTVMDTNDTATTADDTAIATPTPEEIIEAIAGANGLYYAGTTADLKLVAYGVSGTELTELYVATGSATDATKFGATASLTKEWLVSMNKFDNFGKLADDAKVFTVETGAEFSKWKVSGIDSLIDGKDYTVALYGYNENGKYNVALVTNGLKSYDTTAAFAYYLKKGVTTFGDDDEDALRITFIQDGEEKTALIKKSNTTVYNAANALAVGEVFLYGLDEDETIDDIQKVFTPLAANSDADIINGVAVNFKAQFTAGLLFDPAGSSVVNKTKEFGYAGDDHDKDNEVYYGWIAAVESVDAGLKVLMADDRFVASSQVEYIITDETNVVVLDNNRSKNKLFASTIDVVDSSSYDALANGDVDTSLATAANTMLYYAMIRTYNGDVVDAYIINFDNNMR